MRIMVLVANLPSENGRILIGLFRTLWLVKQGSTRVKTSWFWDIRIPTFSAMLSLAGEAALLEKMQVFELN